MSLPTIILLGFLTLVLTVPTSGTASTLTFTNFVHNATPAILWDVMIDDATANLFTVKVRVDPSSTVIGDILQYLCQLRKAEGGLSSMNTTQAGDLVENLA